MLSVSVIGCGWLGYPLAQVLRQHEYCVKGSTTTLEKIPVLQKIGVFSFLLDVKVAVLGEGVQDFFNTDIVVITLPFRRDFIDPKDYQKQITAIILECVKSKRVRHVVFTSSSSVYPDHIAVATEDLNFVADDERAKVLRDIENDILLNKKFVGTVVRLAGLYGETRKIGNFLAARKQLANGSSPVNLIHQDDAVGILLRVIQERKKVGGEIFNACADQHPTRRELYTAAAKAMNLAPPEFIDAAAAIVITKVVSNEKVKRVLGYQFLHTL